MEEGSNPSPGTKARGLPQRLQQLLLMLLPLCFIVAVIIMHTTSYFRVNTPITSPRSAFLPCINGRNLTSWKWIEPPMNLMHNMSDKQLFWRASREPRVKKYPCKRVPKVAFMFLTKGPLPLAPLWERFFKGHEGLYSIYIHSLPWFQPKFSSSSVFYGRQIPSQVSEWGKITLCDAERRLVANALLDVANERFVLLSESCIPLHNFTFIYNYLTGSKHSFLGVFDDPGPYGRGRYTINMLPEINITQWRKGSQWFELNRKLAILAVKDEKYYPKFSEFCKPPCYVDEHYLPTMLFIQAGHMLANRSLTWTDWSRGGAHPATFGGADISKEFLKRMNGDSRCDYNNKTSSSVCFLFARKFSPSALEALTPTLLGF